MPPTGKLKEDRLRTSPASARKHREFTAAERNFWSFQEISNPALQAVKDAAWVKTPVDRFILSKLLEEKKLKPSAPADRATLLRRVTFDLTGSPPTEAELKDFLADRSPKAFEEVVDRLLASPRCGQQWAGIGSTSPRRRWPISGRGVRSARFGGQQIHHSASFAC